MEWLKWEGKGGEGLRRTADSASRRHESLTVFSKERRRTLTADVARGCSGVMVRKDSSTSVAQGVDRT